MEYLKNYKLFEEESENVEVFRELFNNNPMTKDHDLYYFIAGEDFKEVKGGLYKKVLDIENMYRIEPSEEALSAGHFMEMRAHANNKKLYHVWLPKELRGDVDGKCSEEIGIGLVELIDKYKQTKSSKNQISDIDKVRTTVKDRRKAKKKFGF